MANAARSEAQRNKSIAAFRTAKVEYDTIRDLVAAHPHPKDWACEQGQTLADQVDWMIINAGHERATAEMNAAIKLVTNK